MKLLILLMIFTGIGTSFAKENEYSKVLNEIVEGNIDLFKDIIGDNPDFHHDDLVTNLISGDKLNVSEKLLSELSQNSENTHHLMMALKKRLKNNPEDMKKVKTTIQELKKKGYFPDLKSITPLRCIMGLGIYFSMRDVAYSQKAAYFKKESEDQKLWADGVNLVDKGMKAYIPLLCLSELYESTYPNIKVLSKNIKTEIRKKKNIKFLEEQLSSISLNQTEVASLKRYSLFSSEQKALLIRDILTNEKVENDSKILKKYKEFLKNLDFPTFMNGLSDKVTPELREELKKLIGHGSGSFDVNRVFSFVGGVSKELDELFVKELSKGGEGTYSEIKERLQMARESHLKNLNTKVGINKITKTCIGFVGTSLFLAGHDAAIGDKPTAFDNIDDVWYRENSMYLMTAMAAGTVPTCFHAIPEYFRQRKKSVIEAKVKANLQISEYDWEQIEQKLERAKKNAILSKKKPIIRKDTLSIAQGKVFGTLMYGMEKEISLSDTEKFHNFIDRYSGGEKSLLVNLAKEIKSGDINKITAIAESSEQFQFDSLLESILANDINKSANILKEIKGNEVDIIKYLVSLQKKTNADPELGTAIRSNLKELKKLMQLRKIQPPTPIACMASIGAYFGVRDFMFSLHSSYVDPELNDVYAELMDAADNNTIAFMALFCISDLIMMKKELPKYIRELLKNKHSKEFIEEVELATKVLAKDKKLKLRVSKLKLIPSLAGKTQIQFLDKLSQKVAPELELESKGLRDTWHSYRIAGRFESIIKTFREKLTYQDRKFLDRFLNRGQVPSGADKKFGLLMKDVTDKINKDFEAFIKEKGPLERGRLLKELSLLKDKSEAMNKKITKVGLGTKACIWAIGTVVAGVGYSAAVGHKETEIDTKIEQIERENTPLLYKGAAALAAGTCTIGMLSNFPRKVKVKSLKRNSLIKADQKDWNTLEKIIRELNLSNEADVPTGKKSFGSAGDLMEAALGDIYESSKYFNDPSLKKREKKLIKSLVGNKPDMKMMNINQDCIESGVKLLLKGL